MVYLLSKILYYLYKKVFIGMYYAANQSTLMYCL